MRINKYDGRSGSVEKTRCNEGDRTDAMRICFGNICKGFHDRNIELRSKIIKFQQLNQTLFIVS